MWNCRCSCEIVESSNELPFELCQDGKGSNNPHVAAQCIMLHRIILARGVIELLYGISTETW